MPAASTTRRSWSSPHWPRTLGERSAWTSRLVSTWSVCCDACSDLSCSVIAECVPTRFCSTCCSLPSTRLSDSFSGWTRSSIALCRPESSTRAVCWNSASDDLRQREEGLVVLAQGRRRQRGERVAHSRLGLAEQLKLLGSGAAFGRDLGFEPRSVLLGSGEQAAAARPTCRSRSSTSAAGRNCAG